MTHLCVPTVHARWQVTESALQQLLVRMFPEGKGEAILTAKVENVAKKVNGLLLDAKAAVKSFWEARGLLKIRNG